MISHFWPRANPVDDIDSLVDALHEYNTSFTKEYLKRSLLREIDTNPRFARKNLTREWGSMWPRVQEFVLKAQARAFRERASSKRIGPRPNPIPASEYEYTKRITHREYGKASVPEIRARLAELHATVFGRLHGKEILVEYKRAEEEALAEILREKLAGDRDLNSTRRNPLPKVGSRFTVPRPRKPFQITVTNVTAKSISGKDSRGKKWRVPLGYLAPKSKKAPARRPSRRWSKKVASFKVGYGTYFVKKVSGGYKGFVIDEEEYGPYETEVTGVQKSIAAVKKVVVDDERALKKASAKARRDYDALPPEKRWGYSPPYAGPPGPAVEWSR